MTLKHDSWDEGFRTPQGALSMGARATLRLQAGGASGVNLRLWWDGQAILQPMVKNIEGLFEAELQIPETPGLLWYYFIVEAGGKTVFYGNAPDCLGGTGAAWDHEPPSFQITIYDPAFRAPEWMRGTVIYQIMADRFFASKPIAERTPPELGHWHQDWYEPPEQTIVSGDNAANDFFGGDLEGVRQKLQYLKSLGVGAIYFNPLFRARSNHKYDTADYLEIDPTFGDEAAFRALCADAKALGLRIVLDGVFSHTGAYSRYFNLDGEYPTAGACQTTKSPYVSWYTFKKWPVDYDCWWGVKTLPNVREMDEGYLDFIIRGQDAVAAHWLKAGASGWRLDVADELPMPFLRMLRDRVKSEDPEAALIGEVWEDASNKESYGQKRTYCAGDTLDSVMNYPLRDALLGFMTGEITSMQCTRTVNHLHEVYPKDFFYSLMNLLGSHDRPRAVNVLSGAGDQSPPREKRSFKKLSGAQYALGKRRLTATWRFLCALPGMPCLYYGDEAGCQGMADPFCRGTYPWGREDKELLSDMASAIQRRNASPALRTGEMRLFTAGEDVAIVVRRIAGGRDVFGNPAPDETVLAALNRADAPRHIEIDDHWLNGKLTLELPAQFCLMIDNP
jgi:cyclomaltodextrinase / maltogenic alpha-amylase / neopullulanase